MERLAAQGDAPVIILQSLRASCHNPKMRPSSFSTSDLTRTCELEITLRGKGKDFEEDLLPAENVNAYDPAETVISHKDETADLPYEDLFKGL